MRACSSASSVVVDNGSPRAEGVTDHSTLSIVSTAVARTPDSQLRGTTEQTSMTGQTALPQRATALLELHQPGNPVILPTVWDAWSARLAVDTGFAALTVGSHPLADSIGKPDNEGMSFDDLLARVVQITAAVGVPVSVDIESGYALQASRLIDGLLGAGAVGLNIEDTVHSEDKRRRSAGE